MERGKQGVRFSPWWLLLLKWPPVEQCEFQEGVAEPLRRPLRHSERSPELFGAGRPDGPVREVKNLIGATSRGHEILPPRTGGQNDILRDV